jgi:hypothetical protein
MHDDHLSGGPTTRAGFVKRLGKMAAVGLGVALVPATKALAADLICCRSTFCDAECFGSGCCPYGYRCPSLCASCCACRTDPFPTCVSSFWCPC